MTRFFVGKTSDIPHGKIIHIMIDKKKDILVVNIAGNYYAVSNICSHGAKLHEGRLTGKELVCPWHGADNYKKVSAALLKKNSPGIRRPEALAKPSASYIANTYMIKGEQQKIHHKGSNRKINAFISLLYPSNKIKFKISKSRTSADFINYLKSIGNYIKKNKIKRFILYQLTLIR